MKSPYDTAEKNYKAEERQRRIEQMIRGWKRQKTITQTGSRKKYARQMIRLWQRGMQEHIAAKPQLRRQPRREKLLPLPETDKRNGWLKFNEKSRIKHYEKHKGEYPGMSESDYEKMQKN